MKRILLIVMLMAGLFVNLFSQTATAPSAGDGTIGNPYRIATLYNLYWIAENSARWGYNYVQTADIDASETENWYSGAGWSPIGNNTVSFSGSYDGGGHRIIGLTIIRPDQNYIGLFGSGKNLSNILLIGGNVSGHDYTGFLIGNNTYGQLLNCHSTGSVSGNDYVGGLIGKNLGQVSKCTASGNVSGHYGVGGFVGRIESNYIRECYATGNVTGNRYAGGFIGYIYDVGTILNCYSNGSVVRSGSLDIDFGGFVGRKYGGSIQNCYSKGAVYESTGIIWSTKDKGFCGSVSSSVMTANFWDTESSGQTSTAGIATGKTTAQMTTVSTFTSAGWDFVGETANGTNDYWGIDQTWILNGGYPHFYGRLTSFPLAGNGSEVDPYHISNFANLYWIAENSTRWSYHYIQTANIDASCTSIWGGAGWPPIGNSVTPFTGTYDGQNFTIAGLYVNSTYKDYIGLFGYTSNSTIRNLGVTNISVTGRGAIGGLIGYSDCSTVLNCYSTGNANGVYYTGGLVGYQYNSTTVNNCYSSTSVYGTYNTGGLTGFIYLNSEISNCYSTGDVSGTDFIGGLVGNNSYSSVYNSYCKGLVSGSTTGGLAGNGKNYKTVNSFWDIETSGQSTSVGGTGKTTAEMKTQATDTDKGWDFVDESANGTNNYWILSSFSNDGYPYFISHFEIPVGTGSMEDPMRIATLEQLKWVSDNPTSWSYYFVQEANIDAYDTKNWNGGQGWSPIGNNNINFTGTYNGQNHIIEGLFIKRPSSNYIGFFGYTSGSSISNLGIDNCNYTGKSYNGGLIGSTLNSTVINCFTGGGIRSTDDYSNTGGLVGKESILGISTISNCYSCCNVEGFSRMGGLFGDCYNAIIDNSYSVGQVIVTEYYYNGGLIGYASYASNITNSFWDKETSGQLYSDGGTGKTTVQMMTESTFTAAGWDFTNVWKMEGGYPRFKWQTYYPGPFVNTKGISNIIRNSATATGAIYSLGNYEITQHGFCWNTTGNPTTNDSKTEDGTVSATGQFISEMTGLSLNTNYYVRAYATNSKGTFYGNQITFLSASVVSELPIGEGTEVNPYQIASLANLFWITENSGRWDYYFIQTADINASETATWNNGAGWSPIGNETVNFTGKYNGQNYSISGLCIERTISGYDLIENIGLFGYIFNAKIEDMKIVNADIKGGKYVGGIAGISNSSVIDKCSSAGFIEGSAIGGGIVGLSNNSVVSNCFTQCNITGGSYSGGIIGLNDESAVINCVAESNIIGYRSIGGLVGYNRGGSEINNCYAKCIVNGTSSVGGLIGYNVESSTISNCYTQCSVYGVSQVGGLVGESSGGSINFCFSSGTILGDGYIDIGGLVGYNIGTLVENSFWDSEITPGVGGAAGGIAKTTEQMKTESTYTDSGWDFEREITNGSDDIWDIDVFNNKGYPYFSRQYSFLPPAEGDGSEGNPYKIASIENLYWVYQDPIRWDYNYIQTADINASQSSNWFGGSGWSPIGNSLNKFTGFYDGQGYNISDLFIDRGEENYIGLFGMVMGAELTGICVINADFTGGGQVGGLVGHSDYSTINNCYTTGSVTGSYYAGGMAGYNYNSSMINNSYSSVLVSGIGTVGGFIGMNYTNSEVNNCYSTGSVNGTGNIGGFAGYSNNASMNYCFSTGTVTGSTTTGGFIGGAVSGTISNSFWDIETSEQPTSAGGTGKTTAEMKTISTFTGAAWDFVGESVNGTNDYWNINGINNSGYPYLSWQTFVLSSPSGLTITSTSSSSQLSWTAVSGASSYKVYSSENPYASFPTGWSLVTSGVTGTSWTDVNATVTKKFYVVVAVSAKEDENIGKVKSEFRKL